MCVFFFFKKPTRKFPKFSYYFSVQLSFYESLVTFLDEPFIELSFVFAKTFSKRKIKRVDINTFPINRVRYPHTTGEEIVLDEVGEHARPHLPDEFNLLPPACHPGFLESGILTGQPRLPSRRERFPWAATNAVEILVNSRIT